MMIHICIVTMTREGKFVRCIESIFAAIWCDDVELWALEQGGTNYIGEIVGRYGGTPYKSEINLGCAGGRQFLVDKIDLSPDDILIFLDDDLYAANDSWLETLVAPIRAGQADITGVQPMRLDAEFMAHPTGNDSPDYVSGGWCAISARVFLSGVKFDSGYTNYYEDADLARQAAAKGFVIKGVSGVALHHDAHPGNVETMTASRLRYIRKWCKSADRRYNTVLSIKDYGQQERYRKQWEIRKAITTLEAFGMIHVDADILGVGAAREDTIFILSNRVNRVFATDIYLDGKEWSHWYKPEFMMGVYETDLPHDPDRIVVQHMDGRKLRHPDDSFDGIFSSGSIEHFGGWEDIAQAAREIGRVLKPGGIASLSTEFKISGEGDGWQGVMLFTPETIMRYIVEPSGLTMVDEPNWTVDAETLATVWDLDKAVGGIFPPIEGTLRHNQYLFTSVHVALRKD